MKHMRIVAVLVIVAATACGGSKKKKQDDTLIESEEANSGCCCRIETDDPQDPTFTKSAVMECSARHGTCVKTEAKCEGQPEPTDDTSTDSGSLPPSTDDTPNSF
jgi:hypothetical protein